MDLKTFIEWKKTTTFMIQKITGKSKHESDTSSSGVLTKFESEQCCINSPCYEITYNHISRKWLVCNQCLELDFFKTNIKEKVRIQL